MKMTSYPKAALAGFLHAVILTVAYILFTFVMDAILQGECFVTKSETLEVVNGISFKTVQIIGGTIAGLIGVLYLRYIKTSFLVSYFVIFVFSYIILLFMWFVGLSWLPMEIIEDSPLIHWDTLIYSIRVFPIGAFVGMVLGVIKNEILNRINRGNNK